MARAYHMPIQELQHKTTSSEFTEWIRFTEQELENPTPDQMYMSQIALHVDLPNLKHPKKARLDDYNLFKPRDKVKTVTDPMQQKATWLACFGLTPKKDG